MAALSLPSLLLRIQYRVTLVSAFTGLNLTAERGESKNLKQKKVNNWGKNSVPNKHLFFHSTRPVSRRCCAAGGAAAAVRCLSYFASGRANILRRVVKLL